MKIKTVWISGVLFSALVLSASVTAQPPEHAQAQGARDKGKAGASGHERNDRHEQRSPESRSSERYYAEPRSVRERAQESRPYIDERQVRRILQRHDIHQMDSLPPGIRKNLERGKPLPPGIAKRFEGRVAEELPQYPGYEWERVGSDVILIEAATRVVVDILANVLR
ncbi:anti-virulence regulator CigR family protein [Halomonas sediminis]